MEFTVPPSEAGARLDVWLHGRRPDLSRAAYQISGSVRAGKVWSYPIVRADIRHPEWIRVTRENMVRVCRKYDIDIPYIDCINIWRDDDRPIFDMIRQCLPDRLFGCEYSAELGYNMFRLTSTGIQPVPSPEGTSFRTQVTSPSATRSEDRVRFPTWPRITS